MSDTEQKLSLYEFSSCPFCRRVRSFLSSLDQDVESRDVSQSREHLQDLVNATGSQMVPCLRIEGGDGEVVWMHESAHIIDYLKDHFAPQ
ncbi:MAG: glutathione S-transferase N-terminal domain-containing protein [Myxococcota bacterium]|jgi:glutathione S-transferase